MKRGALCLAALAAILLIFTFTVSAEDEPAAELDNIKLSCGSVNVSKLTDGKEATYQSLPEGSVLTVSADEGIASLYIIFDRIYGEWTLSDGETEIVCGKNSFLHEYVDVYALFGHAPKSVTMTFSNGKCSLSEIHAFGKGEVPSWVQIWDTPCEYADLVLFSTHIDDEQLFFAGILPYYAGELGLDVQVVYFTDPFSYHDRPHEQLNGLWTVGVRHYPVSGELKDKYSESANDAYAHQKKYGFEREDIVRTQVEMIRRFKPHVIVGHDIKGEYGHGQHIINCETLMDAVTLAADTSYDPDTVSAYGVWDTPKMYLHLWKENTIVMDWDVPLSAFGGKTAFQVTQDGFLCHKSQHWTWFYSWIFGKNNNITKASEIKTYSPCKYGLFRTTVGLDVIGGDMFENIPQSYAEIAQEERQRLEEESKRLEEESIAESERLRQEEESRRLESESIAESERLNREEESKNATTSHDTGSTSEPTRRTPVTPIIVVSVLIVAAAMLIIVPQYNNTKHKKRRKRRK